MCTSIIEIARAEGMAKRGDEWFPLSRAVFGALVSWRPPSFAPGLFLAWFERRSVG
jgi:hypothetical protein